MSKTIIIGLGNPVLSDDALGIKAATILRQRLLSDQRIEVIEAYTGGLNLMELMEGYDRAIVVDAVTTGCHQPGTLVELSLNDLLASRNTTSSHDASLVVALETGRMLGLKLPTAISFFGIETLETGDFGEELSAPVRHALPLLVAEIMTILNREVTA
ncbi:MAG: hydrogenase maturation protease [Proteobacteria bacterium]|nr:hydrogenase maturation protease [Pseudomonadota bacterium]MBU1715469.1 hydrogenase maturation protease [Pseudomonadota bacterium]